MTRKRLNIYRTFGEMYHFEEVYKLEYEHFDRENMEYTIDELSVEVDLIKRVCNAIENGLEINYRNKVEKDFKFYMTNLTDEQEKDLKETIEYHCWGLADLSHSSIFITAYGEENKKKIKLYAESLVKWL